MSSSAGYANACGTPEARDAIARHHHRHGKSSSSDAKAKAGARTTTTPTSDDVVVAGGASGALELALTALLDEDTALLGEWAGVFRFGRARRRRISEGKLIIIVSLSLFLFLFLFLSPPLSGPFPIHIPFPAHRSASSGIPAVPGHRREPRRLRRALRPSFRPRMGVRPGSHGKAPPRIVVVGIVRTTKRPETRSSPSLRRRGRGIDVVDRIRTRRRGVAGKGNQGDTYQ